MQIFYGIFDRVSQMFAGPLVQFAGDPAAVRFFRDIVADERSEQFKHPSDYDLVKVATFDPDTGTVDAFVVPSVLLTGASLSSVLGGSSDGES